MPQLTPPRSSASLIIVNQRNEVLLVHRNPEARSFGGAHVPIMLLIDMTSP